MTFWLENYSIAAHPENHNSVDRHVITNGEPGMTKKGRKLK
jgi:hypothetical protein